MSKYVAQFVPDMGTIDVAIVTHADLDHFLGMRRIFRDYEVNEFWYTGYSSPELESPSTWSSFLVHDVGMEANCIIRIPIGDEVSPGDVEVIDDGGTPAVDDDVMVQFLNVDSDPPERDPIFGRSFELSEQRNNASMVFKLIYKNISFLVTGDINGRDEDLKAEETDEEIDSEELELWVRDQLRPECSLMATVLQAPHHGSDGSCSLPFLRAVAPEWVVVPAGHRFNHPRKGSLRRLRTVVKRRTFCAPTRETRRPRILR